MIDIDIIIQNIEDKIKILEKLKFDDDPKKFLYTPITAVTITSSTDFKQLECQKFVRCDRSNIVIPLNKWNERRIKSKKLKKLKKNLKDGREKEGKNLSGTRKMELIDKRRRKSDGNVEKFDFKNISDEGTSKFGSKSFEKFGTGNVGKTEAENSDQFGSEISQKSNPGNPPKISSKSPESSINSNQKISKTDQNASLSNLTLGQSISEQKNAPSRQFLGSTKFSRSYTEFLNNLNADMKKFREQQKRNEDVDNFLGKNAKIFTQNEFSSQDSSSNEQKFKKIGSTSPTEVVKKIETGTSKILPSKIPVQQPKMPVYDMKNFVRGVKPVASNSIFGKIIKKPHENVSKNENKILNKIVMRRMTIDSGSNSRNLLRKSQMSQAVGPSPKIQKIDNQGKGMQKIEGLGQENADHQPQKIDKNLTENFHQKNSNQDENSSKIQQQTSGEFFNKIRVRSDAELMANYDSNNPQKSDKSQIDVSKKISNFDKNIPRRSSVEIQRKNENPKDLNMLNLKMSTLNNRNSLPGLESPKKIGENSSKSNLIAKKSANLTKNSPNSGVKSEISSANFANLRRKTDNFQIRGTKFDDKTVKLNSKTDNFLNFGMKTDKSPKLSIDTENPQTSGIKFEPRSQSLSNLKRKSENFLSIKSRIKNVETSDSGNEDSDYSNENLSIKAMKTDNFARKMLKIRSVNIDNFEGKQLEELSSKSSNFATFGHKNGNSSKNTEKFEDGELRGHKSEARRLSEKSAMPHEKVAKIKEFRSKAEHSNPKFEESRAITEVFNSKAEKLIRKIESLKTKELGRKVQGTDFKPNENLSKNSNKMVTIRAIGKSEKTPENPEIEGRKFKKLKINYEELLDKSRKIQNIPSKSGHSWDEIQNLDSDSDDSDSSFEDISLEGPVLKKLSPKFSMIAGKEKGPENQARISKIASAVSKSGSSVTENSDLEGQNDKSDFINRNFAPSNAEFNPRFSSESSHKIGLKVSSKIQSSQPVQSVKPKISTKFTKSNIRDLERSIIGKRTITIDAKTGKIFSKSSATATKVNEVGKKVKTASETATKLCEPLTKANRAIAKAGENGAERNATDINASTEANKATTQNDELAEKANEIVTRTDKAATKASVVTTKASAATTKASVTDSKTSATATKTFATDTTADKTAIETGDSSKTANKFVTKIDKKTLKIEETATKTSETIIKPRIVGTKINIEDTQSNPIATTISTVNTQTTTTDIKIPTTDTKASTIMSIQTQVITTADNENPQQTLGKRKRQMNPKYNADEYMLKNTSREFTNAIRSKMLLKSTKNPQIKQSAKPEDSETPEELKSEAVVAEIVAVESQDMSSPQPYNRPAQKELKCEICSKFFSKPFSLSRHMLLHSGERRYACTKCDYRFIQRSDLTRHMVIHEESPSIPCTKCDKKFRTKKSLQRHLEAHEGSLPYECQFCEVRFRSVKNLRCHVASQHNGIKFKCESCGKNFVNKKQLNEHVKIHENDDLEVNDDEYEEHLEMLEDEEISDSEEESMMIVDG